jgi:hypothetical protein
VPKLVGLLLQTDWGRERVDARGSQGHIERWWYRDGRARRQPGRRVPGRTRTAGVRRTRGGRAEDVEIGIRHDRGN